MRLITEITGTVTDPEVLTVGNPLAFIGQVGESPYFYTENNQFFIQDLSKADTYEVVTTFFNIGLNKTNKKVKELTVNYE